MVFLVAADVDNQPLQREDPTGQFSTSDKDLVPPAPMAAPSALVLVDEPPRYSLHAPDGLMQSFYHGRYSTLHRFAQEASIDECYFTAILDIEGEGYLDKTPFGDVGRTLVDNAYNDVTVVTDAAINIACAVPFVKCGDHENGTRRGAFGLHERMSRARRRRRTHTAP